MNVHHVFWLSKTRYPGRHAHTKARKAATCQRRIVSDSCQVTSSKIVNIHTEEKINRMRQGSRAQATTDPSTMRVWNTLTESDSTSHMAGDERDAQKTVHKKFLIYFHISISMLKADGYARSLSCYTSGGRVYADHIGWPRGFLTLSAYWPS